MQLDLEELISLQEDTHVNHSVKQVGDKAKKMNVISGQKCYELSKVANHDTFWLKMLLVMSQWASTKCLLTWKIKDTPQGRLLYQLVPKTHHIDETEFGSSDKMWMTPTTVQIEPNEERREKRIAYRKSIGRQDSPGSLTEQVMTPSLWPTPRTTGGSRPNGKGGKVLEEEVMISVGQRQRGKKLTAQMWPTPTASDVEGGVAKDVQTANGRFFRQNEKGEKWGVKLRDAVNHTEEKKLWPTPAARDHKGGYIGGYIGGRYKDGKPNNNTLDTQVQFVSNQKKEQKQLSAKWVTWIMGYPEGYLDISTENQNTSQELPKEKKTEPKS